MAGHEWHHILAKFLGGNEKGTAALMTVADHREYHRILRRFLGDAVPGSGNWSTAKWTRFIAESPENAKAVYEALLTATATFDQTIRGYGLFGKLLREVQAQNWAPNL